MERRRFLQATAAPIAAAFPLAARAAPASDILLGFSLYGMRTLDPAMALRTCAGIGYQAVELTLRPGWPTEPKLLSAFKRRELRRLLEELNLALPALMENLSLAVEEPAHRANLNRLKAAAELGRALSPSPPPIIETTLGGKPERWEEDKQQMAERLQSWAEVARETENVIAIKPHVGGALHTPQGARWLLQQVQSPWVKLAYDYSHYELRGYSLRETIESLIGDSVFIHVKDSEGRPGSVKFLLPGDGRIDYVEYFKLVRRGGYKGSVVVEVSGQIHNRPGYDPIAAAKRSYRNLAPALEKARREDP